MTREELLKVSTDIFTRRDITAKEALQLAVHLINLVDDEWADQAPSLEYPRRCDWRPTCTNRVWRDDEEAFCEHHEDVSRRIDEQIHLSSEVAKKRAELAAALAKQRGAS